MNDNSQDPALRRILGLPLLIFYGVGVTIGAGIFALIGEIVRLAGDHAPLTFLIAGLIAAATGISYARLSAVYPVAAGEAFFVKTGLGPHFGQIVGIGVATTGIVSSAVVALAFAGYLGSLIAVPHWLLAVAVIVVLTGIAISGVRISVGFAAIVTLLETGTLIVVCFFGAPVLIDPEAFARIVSLPDSAQGWGLVLSGSLIAFFAFVGFEDIENMAEETLDPHRVLPRAIIWTLVITVAVYAVVAMIAVATPNREAITASEAPLVTLFESVTGRSGTPIAVMATIAMINGILIQIVMASRILYGMARENLLPGFLSHVNKRSRTPSHATLIVGGIIVALALAVPLVSLAKLTSIVILGVFTLVNLSLFSIGRRPDSDPSLRRWRHWGLVGAALSAFLLVTEMLKLLV